MGRVREKKGRSKEVLSSSIARLSGKKTKKKNWKKGPPAASGHFCPSKKNGGREFSPSTRRGGKRGKGEGNGGGGEGGGK